MKGERERSSRLPVDESREQLMVKVARMAWHMDRTQVEIASETGLTRWQVSRLLTEARELGIVRIEIVPRSQRLPAMETQLARRFGLRDAVVVPDIDNREDLVESVAKAAGKFIAAVKPAPMTIGLSWGVTMAAVAHWLPQNWTEGVTAVGINGTVMLRTHAGRTNDVVEIFAQKGQGRAVPLPVPAVVGEAVTREVLERDRIVDDVLSRARRAQMHCFSFGHASEESILVTSGNVLVEEMQRLIEKGAVGDVLGRFVDSNCRIVDPELDARTVGLKHDDLRNAEWVIGVCAGTNKHAIALAVLSAGLVNVIVTDSATASFLIEHG